MADIYLNQFKIITNSRLRNCIKDGRMIEVLQMRFHLITEIKVSTPPLYMLTLDSSHSLNNKVVIGRRWVIIICLESPRRVATHLL